MMSLNFDQLSSVVRSLLKMLGAYLVAKGMTNAAGIVNGEDCAGVVLALLGLAWSHWEHAPDAPKAPPGSTPPTTSSGPSRTLPVWFIIGGLVAFFAIVGCKEPVQRVAYNTIFSVEQTASGAVDGYYALVIQGTLATNGVPVVSHNFDRLQRACTLAAKVSQNGTNALASQALTDELAQLMTLVTNLETNQLR